MAHNRGVGMRGVDAGASESELSAYIQVLEGRHRSLSEQYTDCFTSSAWVVSPIACVLAVVAGRAWKSWVRNWGGDARSCVSIPSPATHGR